MTDEELLAAISFSDDDDEKIFGSNLLKKPKIQIDPKMNSVTATSTTEVKETPKGTTITETRIEPLTKPYIPLTNQMIDQRKELLTKNALSKPDSEYIETDVSKYGGLPGVTPEYLKGLAEAYRQNEISNIQQSAVNTKSLNNISNKLTDNTSLLENILEPYNSPKNLEAVPNAIEEKLKVLNKIQQGW